jgi:hypothetical protein
MALRSELLELEAKMMGLEERIAQLESEICSISLRSPNARDRSSPRPASPIDAKTPAAICSPRWGRRAQHQDPAEHRALLEHDGLRLTRIVPAHPH